METFTLKDLSNLDWERRCSQTRMPADYVPKNKYTDLTANGLTKAVCRFISLKGGQAERINSMGRVIDGRKLVTNVLGQTGLIGSQKYIPGTSTKGTADVSSTILGRSIKWEIKMKDKQSQAQKEYQADIERAGGRYYIIHNWDEFYKYYSALIEEFKA